MTDCAVCKASFPSGYGCASFVFQENGAWFVRGQYGSRLFDTEVWKFVPPFNQFGSFDPKSCEGRAVCDICFQVSVNMQALELTEQGVL